MSNDILEQTINISDKFRELIKDAGLNLENFDIPDQSIGPQLWKGNLVNIQFNYQGEYNPHRAYGKDEELPDIEKLARVARKIEFNNFFLELHGCRNITPAEKQPKIYQYVAGIKGFEDEPEKVEVKIDGETQEIEKSVPVLNVNTGNVSFELPEEKKKLAPVVVDEEKEKEEKKAAKIIEKINKKKKSKPYGGE